MAVTTLAGTSPTSGQLVLTNANQWYPLQALPFPCLRVRISARAVSANGGNIYFLPLKAGQTPVGTDIGESVLPATATGLNYVNIGDASQLWFYAVSAGDRVNYTIES